MSAIDSLRQPEHIGKNRCIPCTAVNIALAFILSSTVLVYSDFLTAALVFTLSLVTIYLRGYLVPGTPTLTKRYLPDRVLRWFDKTAVSDSSPPTGIDVEKLLGTADAIEPCPQESDLCLTDEFRHSWRERIASLREHPPGETGLDRALHIRSESEMRVESDGQPDESFVAVGLKGPNQWPSQAAVIADVAAADELDHRFSQWDDLQPAQIAHILRSLRVFLTRCPVCGGDVADSKQAVESCCRSYDVLALNCQNCGARLFETEWERATGAETAPIP